MKKIKLWMDGEKKLELEEENANKEERRRIQKFACKEGSRRGSDGARRRSGGRSHRPVAGVPLLRDSYKEVEIHPAQALLLVK